MSIQDITSLAQAIGAILSAVLTTVTLIKTITERNKLHVKPDSTKPIRSNPDDNSRSGRISPPGSGEITTGQLL